MFCPQCGNEVKESERFCQNCGGALPQSAAQQPYAAPAAQQSYIAPAAQQPYGTAAAADRPKNMKEFVKSPYCTPDVNTNIVVSSILMLVCAGLSFIVLVAGKSFPYDALLIGGVGLWLILSKSFPAGVACFAVGVLELVLTSIYMGKFAGYFPAIAGSYAFGAVLRARNQYKAYLRNYGDPTRM